ncbi:MAG: aminotransferase class I/II-fold pyridoxal phosphate-dependent enzyme [Dehalococcoidia bacterium]|nr:aminotransferase class I/II-fold pyridoxal phosphate-dependent enzyme [Dehalococcoidia bacterium]
MVAQAQSEGARTAVEDGVNAPDAVVFRGDGEPKTPEGLVARLSEIVSSRGIEADNYSNGGVVRELEERFAGLLGKEDAVFMPSGTLANHLALRMLCAGRPRAIVQEQSHLYHDTGDCVQQLSGINMVPLAANRPYFTLDEVRDAVEESVGGRVVTPVGALMVESPVRRQHGQIMPLHEMRSVTAFCSEQGIPTHLDGARLFMMSAATGVSPAEYSAMFDTVYVSLYKYFGSPYGAMLAGTSDFCRGLYHHRRMFGGGLSSAALAAALALEGVEGFEDRFANAMSKASSLFDELNAIPGLTVGAYEHGSNIFPLNLPSEIELESFANRLAESRVFVSAGEDDRVSPHLTVNTTILRKSNDEIVNAFRTAFDNG